MSTKPQQNLFIKLVTIVLIFLYLQLLLWSTLLRPAIDIDVRWVPKSFFSYEKQSTCIIRMHHTPMVLFESTFFSSLALFGYFCGCAGMTGGDCGIYGCTLPNFEQSMMGVRRKYSWICFVPWIITFTQNWFQNVGEFLMLFSSRSSGSSEVYEAFNVFTSMLLLVAFLSVQALLASEVVCMTLQGWYAMKNINDGNMLWEQRKRFLDGDSLNTAFGLVR